MSDQYTFKLYKQSHERNRCLPYSIHNTLPNNTNIVIRKAK